jgi:hypothetical protein
MRRRCLSALLAAVMSVVMVPPVKAQQVDSREGEMCQCGDICAKTTAKLQCKLDRCNGKKPAAKSSRRHEERLAKNGEERKLASAE